MDGLTTGRIVHYVMDGKHYAAAVTHVWDKSTGVVNLYAFPDGSYPLANNTPTSVPYSGNDNLDNTWHWIEPA